MIALTGCTGDDLEAGALPSAPPTPAAGASEPAPDSLDQLDQPDPDDRAYDVALSAPRVDSVYPGVGGAGLDALHYGLDLAWDPTTRTLDATAAITFRTAGDSDVVQLDFGRALDLGRVTLDGAVVTARHQGKYLYVESPVRHNQRHLLVVDYSGTPRPTAAPTTRTDFSTTGFTITDTGEVWTMQEPYGAYTWYPVNDQPSDKALYDVTVHAPGDWVGISNGELLSQTTAGAGEQQVTTTQWHLAEPAASYLVTLAIGPYVETTDTSSSGVPISYWVPADRPQLADGLRSAPAAVDWLEDKLGPYPFDTLGIVLVESLSGMETQTMITLGIGDYTTSAAVILHEIAHQWYGDQVTPNDWRDVWMNEGMAMYLQSLWQTEDDGRDWLGLLARREPTERQVAGPPAAYDPATFGESNIYYGPAMMWREMRARIGDERFFAVVRDWPAQRDNVSTGRVDYVTWLRRQTGLPQSFFNDWLLSPTSPLA